MRCPRSFALSVTGNQCQNREISTPSRIEKRGPDVAIRKRPYAILGIVALTLSMIADVKSKEADMDLFSVKLPVIAILDGDLFVGNAIAFLSRKETIDLRSVLDANDWRSRSLSE